MIKCYKHIAKPYLFMPGCNYVNNCNTHFVHTVSSNYTLFCIGTHIYSPHKDQPLLWNQHHCRWAPLLHGAHLWELQCISLSSPPTETWSKGTMVTLYSILCNINPVLIDYWQHGGKIFTLKKLSCDKNDYISRRSIQRTTVPPLMKILSRSSHPWHVWVQQNLYLIKIEITSYILL